MIFIIIQFNILDNLSCVMTNIKKIDSRKLLEVNTEPYRAVLLNYV